MRMSMCQARFSKTRGYLQLQSQVPWEITFQSLVQVPLLAFGVLYQGCQVKLGQRLRLKNLRVMEFPLEAEAF